MACGVYHAGVSGVAGRRGAVLLRLPSPVQAAQNSRWIQCSNVADHGAGQTVFRVHMCVCLCVCVIFLYWSRLSITSISKTQGTGRCCLLLIVALQRPSKISHVGLKDGTQNGVS